MSKNTKLNIIIIVAVFILLIPFIPRKAFVLGSTKNYEKLEVKHSSQWGLVLAEDCDTLGLKSGDELEDVKSYIEGSKKIYNKISSTAIGDSGFEFTLYGQYKTDEDGNTKFYIKKWKSSNFCLIDSEIFGIDMFTVYIGLAPIALLAIIYCAGIKIKVFFKNVIDNFRKRKLSAKK